MSAYSLLLSASYTVIKAVHKQLTHVVFIRLIIHFLLCGKLQHALQSCARLDRISEATTFIISAVIYESSLLYGQRLPTRSRSQNCYKYMRQFLWPCRPTYNSFSLHYIEVLTQSKHPTAVVLQ